MRVLAHLLHGRFAPTAHSLDEVVLLGPPPALKLKAAEVSREGAAGAEDEDVLGRCGDDVHAAFLQVDMLCKCAARA